MRNEVLLVYPGLRWKQRVMKMSENQIVAIYMRFKREGKIQ